MVVLKIPEAEQQTLPLNHEISIKIAEKRKKNCH